MSRPLKSGKNLGRHYRSNLKRNSQNDWNSHGFLPLSGMSDCYKIKLKAAGYRLVYRVEDDIMYVTVIAVGKRERSNSTAHSHM